LQKILGKQSKIISPGGYLLQDRIFLIMDFLFEIRKETRQHLARCLAQAQPKLERGKIPVD